MVPTYNLPRAVSFKEKVFSSDGTTYKRPEVALEDTAALQYTGGTTGVSKGAELTHGNIVANMVQARAWIADTLVEGKEIVITPLPLYHIFSFMAKLPVVQFQGRPQHFDHQSPGHTRFCQGIVQVEVHCPDGSEHPLQCPPRQ